LGAAVELEPADGCWAQGLGALASFRETNLPKAPAHHPCRIDRLAGS
jgi:hypothetical protein